MTQTIHIPTDILESAKAILATKGMTLDDEMDIPEWPILQYMIETEFNSLSDQLEELYFEQDGEGFCLGIEGIRLVALDA